LVAADAPLATTARPRRHLRPDSRHLPALRTARPSRSLAEDRPRRGLDGAALAILTKLTWVAAPKWLSAIVGIALGWVGILISPQILNRAGTAAATLVLTGGLCYTAGAIVYARRKPDLLPRIFGYHELFHALVIAAVALQYTAVALVVPR
jgi:predicted membrane channel-forming protein YqfA (hemolysin III family)